MPLGCHLRFFGMTPLALLTTCHQCGACPIFQESGACDWEVVLTLEQLPKEEWVKIQVSLRSAPQARDGNKCGSSAQWGSLSTSCGGVSTAMLEAESRAFPRQSSSCPASLILVKTDRFLM